MNFKTSITSVALTAASLSYGFSVPHTKAMDQTTYCLEVREGENGQKYASTCDHAKNNQLKNLPTLENGCTENQVALTAFKPKSAAKFNIEIRPCLPPNVAQL